MGDSYNRQLVRERERHGFSLREAAKAIGVSALSLFLYENGYYRPTKKHLAKIESVYGPIDFSNEKEYPLETPVFLHERPRFKKKRHIISGILAAVSLGLSITGAVMFRHSATDGEAGYGQVYLQARDAAVDEGWTGRDIASDLEYSYLYQNGDLGRGDILFYQTNSLLYFNNATYSSNMTSLKYPEIGQGRFHYQFGGDIGRSSYLCTFSYKSSSAGIFFSFDTLYGNKPIEKAQNLNIVSKGSVPITEQMAVDLFNLKIGDAMKLFDTILSEALNSEVGFYRDFLPAREEGRVVHFRMQVTGLCLLFPSLLIFFVSAAFLAFSAVRILRPRKRETEKPSEDCGGKPLPKDWNIRVGAPDYLAVWLSIILSIGSFAMLAFCSFGGMFLNLPPLFSNTLFLAFFKVGLAGGVLLRQVVVFSSIKRKRALLYETVRFLLLYLGIAVFETAALSVIEAWGYNVRDLVYGYIPDNLFLVSALSYLIFYFLFFEPAFVRNGSKVAAVGWRLLSLLPVAGIVAITVTGRSYELFYGVKKNIYSAIWLSSDQAVFSLISIVFLYVLFFVKLFLNRRYGEGRASKFYGGNRFNVINNVTACLIVLVIGLVDLAFSGNEAGHYLGIGGNTWIHLLIPFILFIKYGPNGAKINHIDVIDISDEKKEAALLLEEAD